MVNRRAGRLTARRFFLGALASLGVLAGAGAARAVTVPILVVDVESGKVIFQQGATDPWYPASITKLMTTYVALDLVRQGRASLDTMVTVSPAAAAEPPSKMGFRPGTQLTLDNALKIIMVKSANDVAYAIGESLGGSIEGFSDLMNQTAQRIGMRESRWFNPNGLPDPRQWTSARDMAVLGRALMRDFPGQHDLFSISAIQFGRSVMANHNGLLGRYDGADGMKTGFICAGGFNVVASATRNGRRILTVVMGQPSARERDVKAAGLFDYGFAQTPGWSSAALEELPPSSVAAPPDMRAYVCNRKKPMPADGGQGAISANTPDAASAQLTGASGPAAALASFSAAALKGRSLPPRAPLQPIAVWVGHSPAEGETILTQQAEAEKAERAAARSAQLEAAKARREAVKQARIEAKAKTDAARAEKAEAGKLAHAKASGGGAPKTASAYTATETDSGMPEAKPSTRPLAAKTPAKAAAKAATKGDAKAAAGKPAAAKGSAAKAPAAKPAAGAKKAHAAKAGA